MSKVETDSPSQERFVSKSFYEIAGRCISVEADAEWAARFAGDFFSGYRLTASASPQVINLRFRTSETSPPPLPSGLHRFAVPGGFCYADRSRYFLDVSRARIEVSTKEERQIVVWLGPSLSAQSRDALITVFAYALPAALRRCGLYDLHAAGMVHPEKNHGIIFAGASESGKTSLAIRLGALGWPYLSDDSLLISDHAGQVEIRPLRRPFQTDAETLAGVSLPRIDEALGVPIPHDPKKRKLDPDVLFPNQFRAVANASVLCFPSITGNRSSRLQPMDQTEAMMRLIKMCPWATYDKSAASDHLRLLARLVQKCKLYSLQGGRDIFEDPAAIGRLLETIT